MQSETRIVPLAMLPRQSVQSNIPRCAARTVALVCVTPRPSVMKEKAGRLSIAATNVATPRNLLYERPTRRYLRRNSGQKIDERDTKRCSAANC